MLRSQTVASTYHALGPPQVLAAFSSGCRYMPLWICRCVSKPVVVNLSWSQWATASTALLDHGRFASVLLPHSYHARWLVSWWERVAMLSEHCICVTRCLPSLLRCQICNFGSPKAIFAQMNRNQRQNSQSLPPKKTYTRNHTASGVTNLYRRRMLPIYKLSLIGLIV